MKSKQLYEKATKASGLERDIGFLNEEILKIINLSKPSNLFELRTCKIAGLDITFNINFEEMKFILERRKHKYECELNNL